MKSPRPLGHAAISAAKRRLTLAKTFLLANPNATIPDAVKATGISARTMSRARAELGQSGGAPDGTSSPSQAPDDLATVPADVMQHLGDLAANQTIMTKDERLRRLSVLATHPDVPPAAQVSAMKMLRAEEGETEELGPRAPLDRAGRIARVTNMVEALIDFDGIEAAYEALDRGMRAHGIGVPNETAGPAVEPSAESSMGGAS